MKWKSGEKYIFLLFFNFDINYEIHDINYKIWYFIIMLKDWLILFFLKKKKISQQRKWNNFIHRNVLWKWSTEDCPILHLSIFKNAYYNITNDIYWHDPPWYLIIMRHLLRHNTYLIGGYEQLPTRRTNHGCSPEILLYSRHPWRAPVPIRNIPNKDPWPEFRTKGKSALIVGFRFIRSTARDFVLAMMQLAN